MNKNRKQTIKISYYSRWNRGAGILHKLAENVSKEYEMVGMIFVILALIIEGCPVRTLKYYK